ncbi:MAG: DNA-binding protein [Firmicutes bacterium HGW-Firmicutes-3]|jgi:AraC family transcriptional regulator|nr:MAG: DNA-binding protein [Firmicutes bacterium HGW-Firmicutes-3]
MHAWEAVQQSLNYIEEHLSENIRTEKLANVAALSPYYYQRLFKRLVKKPVNEYVKLRRLEKASDALKSKEKRIIDVALENGFTDHANFTRAFKEAYDMTPDEYRRCPVMLNHFIKPDLLLKYTTVDEDIPVITDGIVIEVTRRTVDEPRTFIGIEGEVPGTELLGGKSTGIATTGLIWDEFHNHKSSIQQLLPKGNELGILYMGKAREGCCTYMAGAEATIDIKAEEYASYTLPSGEYVVCGFEAESFEELIGTAIFKAYAFMENYLKKKGLTCGGFVAEMYYNSYPDTSYMELWLPLDNSQKILKTQKKWDNTNGAFKPSIETIKAYVGSILFDSLCTFVETQYQVKPVLEYSKCSLQYGWNIKYKKSGRSLCTLYPMEGYFIALIVIGERERVEAEMTLPLFTEYLQQLYHETKIGMGQKWLMIHVTDQKILEDVKQCIAIRRGRR